MAKMEHYTNTTWPTWDTFKKLFASTFYPADVQQSAIDSLSNLQQKDRQRLIDFEALWDMLTHQADIKEDLNHARSYLSHITRKLQDEVKHYHPKPATYDRWKEIVCEADHVLNRVHYEVAAFETQW